MSIFIKWWCFVIILIKLCCHTHEKTLYEGKDNELICCQDEEPNQRSTNVQISKSSANDRIIFSNDILTSKSTTGSHLDEQKQIYEGEKCNLKNGNFGMCTKTSKCQSIYNGLRISEIRNATFNNLVYCSFIGDDEVICCPDQELSSEESNSSSSEEDNSSSEEVSSEENSSSSEEEASKPIALPN